MTLGHFLSQMGIAPKHLTDRFSHVDYEPVHAHDPHLLYAYEPHPHEHHETHSQVAASKHHYGGHVHKSNAAMSALTLLSFLFFLHILQQCLREHMAAMNANPAVIVMTGAKEGEEPIAKTAIVDKLDKTGLESQAKNAAAETKSQNEKDNRAKNENGFENLLTRISAADYTPSIGGVKYKRILNKNRSNESLSYSGFVNAMS